ncbi:hypothetical protein B7760_01194 [Burkholderia glumae]|nr:hypothetical protein KS03_2599 [Burkholderia glumae LMG 2196 = ATCC 33617]QKM47185.1 hypothetical protein B7760_01194 [Burkholderia glumae]QKM54601.1 hypothetical protein CG017_02638 [Burkholderia glumae]QTP32966.1 hypothetical protein B7759_01545 [Burkholderia glumae]
MGDFGQASGMLAETGRRVGGRAKAGREGKGRRAGSEHGPAPGYRTPVWRPDYWKNGACPVTITRRMMRLPTGTCGELVWITEALSQITSSPAV